MCVRLTVRMGKKKLASHRTDFHEIWYFSIFFRKSVENIQVSLKSDKNNMTYVNVLYFIVLFLE